MFYSNLFNKVYFSFIFSAKRFIPTLQIEDLGGAALVCGGDVSKEEDAEAIMKAVSKNGPKKLFSISDRHNFLSYSY